jgi:hypothetical protein
LTGSTKFGDASNDTHQFTGSVSISGSLTLAGGTIFDGSASYATTSSYAPDLKFEFDTNGDVMMIGA